MKFPAVRGIELLVIRALEVDKNIIIKDYTISLTGEIK